jgi:hypothetical protein
MKTQAGKLEILRMTGEIQGLLFELIVWLCITLPYKQRESFFNYEEKSTV